MLRKDKKSKGILFRVQKRFLQFENIKNTVQRRPLGLVSNSKNEKNCCRVGFERTICLRCEASTVNTSVSRLLGWKSTTFFGVKVKHSVRGLWSHKRETFATATAGHCYRKRRLKLNSTVSYPPAGAQQKKNTDLTGRTRLAMRRVLAAGRPNSNFLFLRHLLKRPPVFLRLWNLACEMPILWKHTSWRHSRKTTQLPEISSTETFKCREVCS